MRRWGLAAFCLLVAAALLVAGARTRSELRGLPVELRWRAETLDPDAVWRAIERSDTPLGAVIWAPLERQRALGVQTKQLNTAVFRGDARLLAGGEPIAGNLSNVSISETAAQALFGSVQAVGRTIRVQDASYTVSGVFRLGKADILLPWDGFSKQTFTRLALCFPDARESAWARAAEDFARDAGMPETDTLLDAPCLSAIAHWEMPVWLIPTRWSDFAAWRRGFALLGERFRAFVRAELAPVDEQCLYGAVASLLYSLLSACFALKGVRLAFGRRAAPNVAG